MTNCDLGHMKTRTTPLFVAYLAKTATTPTGHQCVSKRHGYQHTMPRTHDIASTVGVAAAFNPPSAACDKGGHELAITSSRDSAVTIPNTDSETQETAAIYSRVSAAAHDDGDIKLATVTDLFRGWSDTGILRSQNSIGHEPSEKRRTNHWWSLPYWATASETQTENRFGFLAPSQRFSRIKQVTLTEFKSRRSISLHGGRAS